MIYSLWMLEIVQKLERQFLKIFHPSLLAKKQTVYKLKIKQGFLQISHLDELNNFYSSQDKLIKTVSTPHFVNILDLFSMLCPLK